MLSILVANVAIFAVTALARFGSLTIAAEPATGHTAQMATEES
jgi:hypothetical protein